MNHDLRVAAGVARHDIRDDKDQANVLIEELQALYCSGPAGGGGFRSSLTAQLATGSILVPREEVTALIEVVEP